MTTPSAAPTTPPKAYLHPYLLLALAVSFWAGNVIIGRAMRDTIPPIGLAFWRWTIALIILLPFGWRQVRADWDVLRKSLPITFLLAFLGIALFNTLLYNALHYTTAVNGTLLQSAMPVFVLGYSYFFFRDRMTARQVVGLLLSLFGAVVIVAQGSWQTLAALSFNIGDVLVVVAVVCYAAYTSLLRLRPPVAPLTFLMVTFGLGSLMLLPFYLWEHFNRMAMPTDLPSLAAVGYVVIFPSILSYLFFNYGVAQVGANRAGVFIHLNPALASVLAVLLLGERFQWFHPLGFAFILAGILLVTRGVRPR